MDQVQGVLISVCLGLLVPNGAKFGPNLIFQYDCKQDLRAGPFGPMWHWYRVTVHSSVSGALKSTGRAPEQDDEGDISVINTDAPDATVKAATSGVVTISRKRKFGTLDSFFDHAMSTAQKNAADRKLLRFIIHGNISFVSVDDPYLDEFLHDLRRFALTHNLLDAEAADVFLREADRLKSSKLLTMLEDGWEDQVKRSIYGNVAAGIDAFPIIMSLNDMTGERGNAPKCLDIALEALQLMGDPDFTELERVERGEAIAVDEDNMDVVGDGGAGGWSFEELMGQ
ncbi:hypothetical protein B0H11DRAFT_1901529 [Mycena galericulata]|nr:hypothetical protein B0H11DRAFT_1901529 [Mycena galericulata]